MAFLFFMSLAFTQAAGAATACAIAFFITMPPSTRRVRGKAIRASLLGAGGGFVGSTIAYVLVIVAGLAWKVVELFHLGGPPIWLGFVGMGLLPVGYIVGTVGGSYIGWTSRIPIFDHLFLCCSAVENEEGNSHGADQMS